VDETGGGLSSWECNPNVVNCVVSGNSAGENGGGASGEYGNPTLTNCTITENLANNGGGIYYDEALVTVNNCILWGDSPQEIVGIGTLSVTFSDVEGGWEGEGNMDENPCFVPFPIRGFEHILRPNSPCIDAGDPHIYDKLYDWHPMWPSWYRDSKLSDMGAYGGQGNWKWLR
jgi:hypothetical protein